MKNVGEQREKEGPSSDLLLCIGEKREKQNWKGIKYLETKNVWEQREQEDPSSVLLLCIWEKRENKKLREKEGNRRGKE